jgi:hypothetical protein
MRSRSLQKLDVLRTNGAKACRKVRCTRSTKAVLGSSPACMASRCRGAFFTLALVSVQARRAFPMRLEQVVRSAAEKAASKAKAASKKPKAQDAQRRLGRPKGSKNKPKADGTFMPELLRITGWLEAWLHLVAGGISLTYLVLDGHFGNHNALQMARQRTLHLISKLRCDAALSFPLHRPLCRTGAPAQIWPQDQLRPPPGVIPPRDDGGGAHPAPRVPGPTAA